MPATRVSRRTFENGSKGTDHGSASVMLAMGGGVRGGLYGTAPSLNPDSSNATLENNGNDVKYDFDFRSVYARVIDNWLGGNSVSVLGGDFRKAALEFIQPRRSRGSRRSRVPRIFFVVFVFFVVVESFVVVVVKQ